MPFQYKKFSSLAFMTKPSVLEIDGSRIEYMGFCLPENAGKTPVVFLGGAFQNFFSFKKDVQVLVTDHPIILIDLPSQGSNAQLCEHFEFEDFATLLAKFMDHFKIPKITPIGLSYGSATAFYLASLYPEKVEKLIMGGTTPRVRDSYRALLEDSMELLLKGEMDIFSQGAVMNLINYSKRAITKIPERVIKGFYKNMLSLKENDKLRYVHNTRRLLRLDGVHGNPTCPALVLTGEYDNFTTPYENYLMSQKIAGAHFILIKESDHLANLEKRDEVIASYQMFLKGHDLNLLEGITVMDPQKMQDLDRRLDPRLRPSNPNVVLVDGLKNEFRGQITDISYQGCQISLDEGLLSSSIDRTSYLELRMEEADDLGLTAHILRDEGALHCIFRRGDFQQGVMLENYLQHLAQ